MKGKEENAEVKSQECKVGFVLVHISTTHRVRHTYHTYHTYLPVLEVVYISQTRIYNREKVMYSQKNAGGHGYIEARWTILS